MTAYLPNPARIPGPGLHVHHGSDEFFYVVKGRYRFQVGDRVLEVSDGATLFVPRGTPHGFMNIGDECGQVMGTFTPAGPELTFVEVPTWPPGPPDPELLADLGRRTQSERIDGVMGFFGAIFEHGEMLAFGIDRFANGGETVVVLGHEQVQFKAAGASYQTRWAHVHEVRDGKIARIHAGDARCLS